MTSAQNQEPPGQIRYTLEEALELLEALEDARDVFITSDNLAELLRVEHQIQLLNRRLGFDQIGESDG